MKRPLKKMTLTSKTSLNGFLFTTPFILGFIFFFLQPLIQSVRFVFSDVDVLAGGYNLTFSSWDNLNFAFKQDSNFIGNLRSSIVDMFWQVPIVIIFALIFALVLNQKFKGRIFARAVFFIPAIIGSGLLLSIITKDAAASAIISGDSVLAGTKTESSALRDLLISAGFGNKLVNTVTSLSDSLFNLTWKTGIQMIIFLAGLQSISPALYEAASIEGATAWESFWKVTLPMLLPILKLNLVYSIVDSFTSTDNKVMQQVMNNVQLSRYGWASAMAWTYFILVTIVLAIVFIAFHYIERDSSVKPQKRRR